MSPEVKNRGTKPNGCAAQGGVRVHADAEICAGRAAAAGPAHPAFAMKTHVKWFAASVALAGIALVSRAAPAAENWENLCAKCHGPDGKGQTKAGKKVNAKDYTDAKVQAQFTDAQLEKVIADGAFDKAGKEKMKAYKDELTAGEVKELVAYVRKFKS
jgi:cytochrome c6